MRRKLIAILLVGIGLFTFVQSQNIPAIDALPLSAYYAENAYPVTESVNVVTSIYLFFRVYDTLFEALMLLFSIIGVIYMSIHEGETHDD